MSDAKRPTAILPHKLAAPQPHRNAVERRALLSRLAQSANVRVVLIHGPAGHGKTSLMLQAEAAARESGALTAWLSVDETDNDSRRFLDQLQTIFTLLDAQADEQNPAKPDQTSNEGQTDWLFTRITRLERPAAIFLDDLHAADNPATIGLLRHLVTNSPQNVRWYIASRTVPDLAIPRLVVGEEAVVLHPEDLRFSRDETRIFFDQGGRSTLSDAERDAIYTATAGWPAALQLYRLALESPAVRETLQSLSPHQPRELTDYLADDVLARQSPQTQDFLLKTSLLQRMSAPLCNAILDRTDSFQVLSALERAGLFVRRLDSEGNWYTYHAIFSKFLQAHTRAIGGGTWLKEIHHRSAQWYVANGFLEDGVYHYCEAGEYAKAADTFDQLADRLVADGQMVTVERWSDQIPLSELEQRPGLVAKIAWSLAFLLSRHRKLGPLMNILRDNPSAAGSTADPIVASCMVRLLEDDLAGAAAMVAGVDAGEPTRIPFRAFELSAVSNARGYAAMAAGDFDAAHTQLALGRSLSDQAGATFTWAYSIGKSSITLVAQGRLQEALVRFRNALSDPRMFAAESISKACLASGYIMALYEADELDAALEHFVKFRELAANAFIHDYLAVAYIAVARIYDIRGQSGSALKILDEAEDLAFAGHWPRITRLIKWARVHREILAGRVDQAKIVAGRITDGAQTDPAWIRFSEETSGDDIGHIRLSIHTGRPTQALSQIAPLLSHARAHNRILRQIKLHALAALAEHTSGATKRAHGELEHALKLASPGKYIRAFLEEGEQMAQLLLAHARIGEAAQTPLCACTCEKASLELLARLVQATGGESNASREGSDESANPHGPPPDVVESFTKREQKVLSMLANYASNEQIAAGMFITKDTLKYHLKNIYGKLSVKSRLEAIRVARDMGFK